MTARNGQDAPAADVAMPAADVPTVEVAAEPFAQQRGDRMEGAGEQVAEYTSSTSNTSSNTSSTAVQASVTHTTE
jgi:hypothetical protein